MALAILLVWSRNQQRIHSDKHKGPMTIDDLGKTAAADNEINWVTATFMALFHVGAVAALFFFSWKAFFVALFLYWVSGSLGIGMGYHRLLTHRGYKTPNGSSIF